MMTSFHRTSQWTLILHVNILHSSYVLSANKYIYLFILHMITSVIRPSIRVRARVCSICQGREKGGGGSKYQVNNDHEIVRVMSYIVPGVLNLLGKCTE